MCCRMRYYAFVHTYVVSHSHSIQPEVKQSLQYSFWYLCCFFVSWHECPGSILPALCPRVTLTVCVGRTRSFTSKLASVTGIDRPDDELDQPHWSDLSLHHIQLGLCERESKVIAFSVQTKGNEWVEMDYEGVKWKFRQYVFPFFLLGTSCSLNKWQTMNLTWKIWHQSALSSQLPRIKESPASWK